jgi:hypothetical protein
VSPQVSIASPTSTSKALFFLNGLNQCSFENEYVPRVGIVAMLDKQCLNVYDMQRSRIAERIGCTNTVFYPLRRGGPMPRFTCAQPLSGVRDGVFAGAALIPEFVAGDAPSRGC